MIRKAILPVAGLGTRFLPATKAQPKEMLPLVDKPVIQFLVEEAVDAGIEEIIFVTGKGKRAIEDHFDYAPELERALSRKGKKEQKENIRRISDMAHFSYVRQKQPRGPGDALLAAQPLVGDEPVAVLYGDDVVFGEESGLSQMVRTCKEVQAPVIALERVPKADVEKYGIVTPVRGEGNKNPLRINGIVEKPAKNEAPSRLAAIGKYIITPSVWQQLKKVKAGKDGEIGPTESLNTVAEQDHVYGLELDGERFDCGSKIGYLKAMLSHGLEHEETKQELYRYMCRRVQ